MTPTLLLLLVLSSALNAALVAALWRAYRVVRRLVRCERLEELERDAARARLSRQGRALLRALSDVSPGSTPIPVATPTPRSPAGDEWELPDVRGDPATCALCGSTARAGDPCGVCGALVPREGERTDEIPSDRADCPGDAHERPASAACAAPAARPGKSGL